VPSTLPHPIHLVLVWPVTLAQVWTHYKIGKLNMWKLFCNVCIDFLNSQIWKEIVLKLNGKTSSVITFLTDFSFQNLIFWNLFKFSTAEITLKSISPTFWIQILPNKFPLNHAHQDLSNNTKGTFQFLQNFQLRFNLIFSEEIIQYSRTFASQVQTSSNQAHAPLLVESFSKTPRTRSEASQFGGSHNYKTKQDKLPSFLHRLIRFVPTVLGSPNLHWFFRNFCL
jgi:hypothetical protein